MMSSSSQPEGPAPPPSGFDTHIHAGGTAGLQDGVRVVLLTALLLEIVLLISTFIVVLVLGQFLALMESDLPTALRFGVLAGIVALVVPLAATAFAIKSTSQFRPWPSRPGFRIALLLTLIINVLLAAFGLISIANGPFSVGAALVGVFVSWGLVSAMRRHGSLMNRP
jgi:hypothetical protein